MGVPGFFLWLKKNKNKLDSPNLILKNIGCSIKWLMLDANCLIHPCVANILSKYKNGELNINKTKKLRIQIEDYIWEDIEKNINEMIEQTSPEYIYLAIDGVAPMGKILQQRQRRYKYLYDTKIKISEQKEQKEQEKQKIITKKINISFDNYIDEPELPIQSIELTPGTEYMERIHNRIKIYMNTLNKRKIHYVYSSYHDEGEGEHKILEYIRKNIIPTDSIVIYGLDADLLFLALGLGTKYNLYVMRESEIFSDKSNNKISNEIIEYNYVQIAQLNKMILKLDMNTNDFILLCYLIGNDFLPRLLTIDVKKNGLDKILDAWKNVKNKYKIDKIVCESIDLTNNKQVNIDWKILQKIFEELSWTEKYIWKNINREKMTLDINMENDLLNKFIQGQEQKIDFLDKIEFGSPSEYYNYYLGLDESGSFNTEPLIIKKMVCDYIMGIEWAIKYYLKGCVDWGWGYDFMIAPLIKDIVKYYPTNPKSIVSNPRILKPIEQLILAIPPQTYHYVIPSTIIDKIKSNKNMGYMFPESYGIDINKESYYWKCCVKIPMVDYKDFINEIKTIEIDRETNKIYSYEKNF